MQEAYDPRFGARPLRRWLEHQVVTELSRLIVSGSLQEGGSVTVDVTRYGTHAFMPSKSLLPYFPSLPCARFYNLFQVQGWASFC